MMTWCCVRGRFEMVKVRGIDLQYDVEGVC